jgi:tetratricopeptide (TPR) repeat protein
LRSLAVFEPGSSYNILLLPFSPDQQCQSRNSLQESAVRDHLNSLPETEDMALQIAFLNGVACPTNSEEAKATGQVHNAQLVIWGDSKVDNSGKELIQVSYVSLESGKANPVRPVAQQIGQRALGDVYDLQEGSFAGEPQDLVYWILAVAHLRNEDYPSAISYLEQITMREQSEYSVLMHMMAKCYQGMDRLEDALTAYGEAIFLDPDNPNVYHHRGRLYQQLNEKELALADYAEAIRLNPQHLKAQFQQKLLMDGKGISGNEQRQTASIPVANN